MEYLERLLWVSFPEKCAPSWLFYNSLLFFWICGRTKIWLEESFKVRDCYKTRTAHPYRGDGLILDAPPDGSNVDVQEARNVGRSNVGTAVQVVSFCSSDVLALFTSGLPRQQLSNPPECRRVLVERLLCVRTGHATLYEVVG
jgi:hypothetical protein